MEIAVDDIRRVQEADRGRAKRGWKSRGSPVRRQTNDLKRLSRGLDRRIDRLVVVRSRRKDQPVRNDAAFEAMLDEETERGPFRQLTTVLELELHPGRVTHEAQRNLLPRRRLFDAGRDSATDARGPFGDRFRGVQLERCPGASQREGLAAAG